MRKLHLSIITTALLFQVTTYSVHAQSIMGKNYINAGIGLSERTDGNLLVINYEHGFSDKVSAGITLGYSGGFGLLTEEVHSIAGIRGSYHLNEILKINSRRLDVYSGASVFYKYDKLTYPDIFTGNYYNSSVGSVGVAIHAGGHFYISKRTGAFCEVGFGISAVQFGVSFKF